MLESLWRFVVIITVLFHAIFVCLNDSLDTVPQPLESKAGCVAHGCRSCASHGAGLSLLTKGRDKRLRRSQGWKLSK